MSSIKLGNSVLPLVLLLTTVSCGSSLAFRETAINDYQMGRFVESEKCLSKQIDKKKAFESYTESNDAIWMLLDRATLRFAAGKIEESIVDYSKALDAIDYYTQPCHLETTSKFLLDDAKGAYVPNDFEAVLARLYFALALLQKGDAMNATALLLQAENFMQLKKELNAPDFIQNPLVKYLFAALLEQKKDYSNAHILYIQVAELIGKQKVKDDLLRIERKETNHATLICICHNGNAPYKISHIAPISIISAYTLESILSASNVQPALSTLTGVAVPKLISPSCYEPRLTRISCNNIQRSLECWYDIDQTANQQLEKALPEIGARAAARHLLRRSAVFAIQKQHEIAGLFADIATFAANIATKADTRSWGTLPSTLDLARFEVEPGVCKFEVDRMPSNVYQLHLNPGDLCVINIFNIHPQKSIILIPKQFLIEGESS